MINGDIQRRPQPFLAKSGIFFLIELTNWRWSWDLASCDRHRDPLLGMLAFAVFAADDGPQTLQYVWSGNFWSA